MSQTLKPLIDAAREGDRRALNELARCADRFTRIFRGSLSRRVRQVHGSTVDFVLEGLGEALSRLKHFEYQSDEEFYGWITRLIRSRIIDAERHERCQKRDGPVQPMPEHDLQPPSPDPTASTIVSREEIRTAFASALLELQVDHPQEIDVLLMKIFEGKTWSQIQALLGLSSEKRARTLYARGLDLLRPRVGAVLGKEAYRELLGP
jgi:RNA polymerase sigma factor (sigma-70 family)